MCVIWDDRCYHSNCICPRMTEAEEEVSFFARRTESIDAEGVSKLLTRNTEAVFGRINIDHVM